MTSETPAPPEFPAGPYPGPGPWDPALRDLLRLQMGEAPARLRAAVAGLSGQQLGTYYKNWTIRQIVHHLGDSHLHSLIRFKWALTEDCPTIKPFDESEWAETPDSKHGDIEPSLNLFQAVHARWLQVLQSMQASHFERAFHHPELGRDVTLWEALQLYAWHARHHTGQIEWLRQQRQW